MITLEEVMSIARPYFEAQKRANEGFLIFSDRTGYSKFDGWQRQLQS